MSSSVINNPLAALQEKFALIDLCGEIRVIDKDCVASFRTGILIGEPPLYKRNDGGVLMNRYLETLPIPCKPKQVIEEFWTSPQTTLYSGTAFTPKQTPQSILNFWIGPVVDAKPGNWVILRDYLRDVICAGQDASFSYLINFLAHMVQKPEEKPGVMIVLLGGQGTGKGMFFQLLRAIWPRTTLIVSDVEQVIGRFNAALERNFVISMDEALFVGDKKAMDRLKSTITEPVLKIEQKFQPPRFIESVHRFFAASNHDHFAHVDRDDRRLACFRVSDKHKQDSIYFQGIADAIDNPNIVGALLYYLQRRDLDLFDVRARPKNTEQVSQKIKSLFGFDRYWYEVLCGGAFYVASDSMSGSQAVQWEDEIFVTTETLLGDCNAYYRGTPRFQPMQSQQVSESLKKLCPSAKNARKSDGLAAKIGGRSRGFDLPSLETARKEFCAALGGTIDWD